MDGVSLRKCRGRKEALRTEPQGIPTLEGDQEEEPERKQEHHGVHMGRWATTVCCMNKNGWGPSLLCGRSLPAGLARTRKRAQETQTSQEEEERERNMGSRMFWEVGGGGEEGFFQTTVLVSHRYLNKDLKECRVEIRDFIYLNLHEQSKRKNWSLHTEG